MSCGRGNSKPRPKDTMLASSGEWVLQSAGTVKVVWGRKASCVGTTEASGL